jgi:hypothetical protein
MRPHCRNCSRHRARPRPRWRGRLHSSLGRQYPRERGYEKGESYPSRTPSEGGNAHPVMLATPREPIALTPLVSRTPGSPHQSRTAGYSYLAPLLRKCARRVATVVSRVVRFVRGRSPTRYAVIVGHSCSSVWSRRVGGEYFPLTMRAPVPVRPEHNGYPTCGSCPLRRHSLHAAPPVLVATTTHNPRNPQKRPWRVRALPS